MDDGPPRDLERLFTELGLRKYGLEAEGLEKDEDEAVADGTCCYGGGVVHGVCEPRLLADTLPLYPCPSLPADNTHVLRLAILTYFVSWAASSQCFSLPPSFPSPTQPVASAPGSVGGPWCSAPSFFFPSSSTALW